MKYLLPLTMFLCFCFVARSQQPAENKISVAGKIADSSTARPIEYVTVTLLDNDNNNRGATYSQENGSFKILADAGTFRLEVTATGYITKEVKFTIPGGQGAMSLPVVYLQQDYTQMAEVTVSASRKLVEKKPGMLVYIAENDITNKGGTAADVLRKAPVITVDAQGNVTMRGNGNIKILVNGKYSGQMARSVSDALNMMPADNIKSVEIITNPSAKYDAEGAAGVINIITKKNNDDFSGTVEVSASNWEQMVNPRLSLSKNKWSVTINGHLHRLRSKTVSELERLSRADGTPDIFFKQQVTKENTAPHGSGDISITYMPDEVSEFSLGVNTWFGNWPDDRSMRNTVSAPGGAIIEEYLQFVDTKAKYLGSDINMGYSRKLKKPGQEVTLLAQFSPSKDRSWYETRQFNLADQFNYGEINDNRTNNREFTGQADYIHPLRADGKYILETGLKMIGRNVNNAYNVVASSENDPWTYQEQAERSDHFEYTQNVFAGYGLVKLNFKKGWYTEAGARLERTTIKGDFRKSGSSFTNDFTNFIPTATVSKKIDEAQTVHVSYTRRLTRPYIWDLNPNADVSDPKNIESGNPALQPEMSDQAELAYSWSSPKGFFLNGSLFWRKVGNAIVEFTTTDSAGVSFTSKQNLAANQLYGFNFSASGKAAEKFTVNTNLNVTYLDYTSDALKIYTEGWAADINLNVTQKLAHRFSVQAFGEYNTRLVTLQGSKNRRYYYSVAVKKDIPASKLMITLSAMNMFSKALAQTEFLNMPGFSSTIRNQFYNRTLKLTVNWDFGKAFEQKERKKISNDDINVQGKG